MVVNPDTFMIPVVDREKCTGCGTCETFCLGKCITMDSEDKAVIESFYCENCGICADVCPDDAIILPWDKWQKDKVAG